MYGLRSDSIGYFDSKFIREMKLPRPATLKKYGLSQEDWVELYNLQSGCCPICGRKLEKTIVVDHMHVRGFKKMSDEKKRRYIRGLTDWWCNKTFLGRGITIERAKNVVAYLERFEKKLQEYK